MEFNNSDEYNPYNKEEKLKKKNNIYKKNLKEENYSVGSRESKRTLSIVERIDNIQNLLNKSKLNKLNPLKNMDVDIETDFFEGITQNIDNKSKDARVILGKQDQDFYAVLKKLNCRLEYKKSGAYGNTFKGTIYDKNGNEESYFCFKVVAYSKGHGKVNDICRPENAEINMLRLLSYFVIKKFTRHIVLPIGIFNTPIKPFVEDVDALGGAAENEKYKEFVQNYKKGYYHSKASVIMCEWASHGDLSYFLRKHYENLGLLHWKCLFFQIISTLATIQNKYPSFRHNDLKANNILISKITESFNNRGSSVVSLYNIEGTSYYVPDIGYCTYIWDFDFACIPGVVENNKIYQDWTQKMNITSKQNRYYDLHYFFCTLVYKGFLPELFKSNNVPIEVKEFIKYVIPKQYRPVKENKNVNKKCRLQVDDEYIIPIDLLEHNFFDVFKEK